jgi:hypothetical protein
MTTRELIRRARRALHLKDAWFSHYPKDNTLHLYLRCIADFTDPNIGIEATGVGTVWRLHVENHTTSTPLSPTARAKLRQGRFQKVEDFLAEHPASKPISKAEPKN